MDDCRGGRFLKGKFRVRVDMLVDGFVRGKADRVVYKELGEGRGSHICWSRKLLDGIGARNKLLASMTQTIRVRDLLYNQWMRRFCEGESMVSNC